MRNLVFIALVFCVSFSFAQQERTLTHNKKDKLIDVVYYHDNGQISQTGSYTLDGKLQGDWLSYDENGNKIASAKYDNGEKVGKWFFWDENILREVDYTNNSASEVVVWYKGNVNVASRD